MDYIFECPHCKNYFIMNEREFNCAIIRHAVYKGNYMQINPHMSKNECDILLKNDLVIGCAKPARIIKNDKNEYIAVECDYI